MSQPQPIEDLRERVERFFKDVWNEPEFDSQQAYEALEAWLGNVVTIRGDDSQIRETARYVIRNLRGADGKRTYESATLLDEAGEKWNCYVRLDIAAFVQARSIIQKQERMAWAMIRKANDLARRARELGHDVQIPFAWVDDEGTPEGN